MEFKWLKNNCARIGKSPFIIQRWGSEGAYTYRLWRVNFGGAYIGEYYSTEAKVIAKAKEQHDYKYEGVVMEGMD